MLAAGYLRVLHDGAPTRAVADHGEVMRIVGEWFPVRALAMDAVLRRPADVHPDTWAALVLAETRGVPLVTKEDEVRSRQVPVLHS